MKKLIKQTLLIVLLLTAPMAYAAKNKPVDHAENAYNAGMVAYDKKDFQKAVYAFQNSIEYNSKLYKSHYMLGLALIMNNEQHIGERILKKAVISFPNEWQAAAILGEYYDSKNDYSSAITYYKKALDAKTITRDDRSNYTQKMEKAQQKQKAKWRVTEEMKSKILRAITHKLDKNEWWDVLVEKKGENIHVVYAPKDDDYENDNWKKIFDVECFTDNKRAQFQFINEKVAENYYSRGGDMHTLEEAENSRLFETRTLDKPRLYILGRIFYSPYGFCLAQFESRSKIKEKDMMDWTEILQKIRIEKFD